MTLPRLGIDPHARVHPQAGPPTGLTARPASCRPLSRARPSAGLCPSRSKSKESVPERHARPGVRDRRRPRCQDTPDWGGGHPHRGRILTFGGAESIPIVAPPPPPGWPVPIPARPRAGGEQTKGCTGSLAHVHARYRERPLQTPSTRPCSDLAARYETVVAEDLDVSGMLANRTLARSVADQGFGTERRLLGYKTTWNGGTLLVADRWYPSSKTCSACGWRKPSLTLAERTFTCEARPPGGHGSRRERRTQLPRPPDRGGHRFRYRQWGGNRPRMEGLRLRRSCKTRPGWAVVATPLRWKRSRNPAPPTWVRPGPPLGNWRL